MHARPSSPSSETDRERAWWREKLRSSPFIVPHLWPFPALKLNSILSIDRRVNPLPFQGPLQISNPLGFYLSILLVLGLDLGSTIALYNVFCSLSSTNDSNFLGFDLLQPLRISSSDCNSDSNAFLQFPSWSSNAFINAGSPPSGTPCCPLLPHCHSPRTPTCLPKSSSPSLNPLCCSWPPTLQSPTVCSPPKLESMP